MIVHVFNPLSDKRWDDLIARHPLTSAFHQRGWLEALCRTYGYQPLVLTTAAPDSPLTNGLVLCHVSSWLTGTRLVSLPFSDHCEPLLSDREDLHLFANWLRTQCDLQRWKYIELRPLLQDRPTGEGLSQSHVFCFHELSLEPSLRQLFDGLHKDCIQRRIRKAEKQSFAYEVGCSKQLGDDFYKLLLLTRRRHQLLPQPRAWFANLIDCMGDNIQIRLAKKDGVPIAALLTLRHRSSVIYKYGCSDEKFHHLGGMPFLFWRLIEESKASGAVKIDLGRSDLDQEGLLVFKDRLGATRKSLTYYRYPKTERGKARANKQLSRIRPWFRNLPGVVSLTAGRLLYRHMG